MLVKPTDMTKELLKQRKECHAMQKGVSTGFQEIDEFILLNKTYLLLCTGQGGCGKALAIDTLIPTPFGLKYMADIHEGDIVYSETGDMCFVTKTTEVMFSRPCYEMTFSDGTKVICDEGHQWFTEDVKAKQSALSAKRRDRVVPRELKPKGTDQSHKRTYPSVKTTTAIAQTLRTTKQETNHSVANCKAVKGIEQDLLIAPYTLGVWLGDGRKDYSCIYCEEPEILERIHSEGYTTREQAEPHHYGIINGLIGKLKELSLVGNKHIPEAYLNASIGQRTALLQALMDTDGYCSISGHCEFCSTTKPIADGVYHLLSSLGYKAVMSIGRAKLYGKDCGAKYRILFTPHNDDIFYLKRKKDRVKPSQSTSSRYIIDCKPVDSVPVKCIQVDSESHLYLCTKAHIPTHNSEFLDAIALNTAIGEGWKWTFFSPENFPMEAHLRKHVERYVGKGLWQMTPKEITDSCEYLSQYLTWMDPPDEQQSPEALTDLVGESITKNGCDAYVLDPWNELDHSAGSHLRDDQYISVALMKIRKFNRKNNLLGCIVIHPKGLQRDRDGNYPIATLSDCHGGIMWRNKGDLGICLHRPDMSKDTVTLYIQKVKFKTMGHVGAIDLHYDKASGRFKTANQTEFLLPLQVESPF